MLCFGAFSFGQTVQFETSPAAQLGQVNLCQGSSVNFTNTSIGLPPSAVFNWSFSGGNPSSAVGTGPHAVSYSSIGIYNASLTVNGQVFDMTINVVAGPSASLAMGAGSNFSLGIFNNQPYFLACDGNAASFLSLSSNSLGTDASSVHTINWGNGQPNFVFTGDNFIFHPVNLNASTFYLQGSYELDYSINNGACTSTLTYNIYAGTPPGGSIENTSQAQTFCIPGNVVYNINTQANGPGTLYEILFNDGFNSTYTFNHPPPTSISHTFPVNSCGSVSTFDGTTYFNSFSVTMNTSNPCGQSTSGIAPIIISEMPEADFNVSDTVVCVNSPITFSNMSLGGMNVTGGVSQSTSLCSTQSDLIWTHDPVPNVDLISGDLGSIFVTPIGSQWFPGSEEIVLSFSQPGTYAITLNVRNKPQCGVSSITKTVCVLPELVADFTLPTTTACAPYLFLPQNLSNFVQCDNSNVFQWNVNRSNPENCPYGSNPGFQFTNGTNASSINPQINFTAPGIYKIRLINSLQFPVPGASCQSDTIIKTLIIKDIPYLELDSMAICEGSSYTISPISSACYADNGLIYNWDFSPSSASISSSTLAAPTISYSSMGLFNYSVNVSNECGQIYVSAPIFVEEGINIQATGPLTDCVSSPLQLNGTISGGVTTGSWSSNLSSGNFVPSLTTLNPQFNFPNGYTGDITFVLSSDPSPNGCPPAYDSVTVNINTTIFANTGTYPPICINTPLDLTGSFGGLATSAVWTSIGGGIFSNPNDPLTTFTPPLDFTGNLTLILSTDDPPGDCNQDIDTIQITVVSLPTITAFSDTTICEGQSLTIFATGAATYDWSQGLGIGSSHSIAPTSLTTYDVVGTDAFGCQNSDQITVAVLPAPDIIVSLDSIYCTDELTTEVVFTSSFSNAIFLWNRSNENIGLSQLSGQGDIPQFLTTNTTNDVLISTFNVTPEAANCPGQATAFNIAINPIPQITNAPSQTICSGTSDEVVWTTNLAGGLLVLYEWELISAGNDLTGAVLTGQGNLPSMNINNNSNQTQELIYQVNYHLDDCFGVPFLFTIIVHPTPSIDSILSQEICSGFLFDTVSFSSTVPGATFSWNIANTNIPPYVAGFPQPSGVDFIAGTLVTNNGIDPYELMYEVIPSALGCSGQPGTFSLLVNPQLIASTSIPNQFVCNNNPSQLVDLQVNVLNSSVAWHVASLPTDVVGINITSGVDAIPQFSLMNLNASSVEIVIFGLVGLNSNPAFCPGDTSYYEIAVFPTPVVNPIGDSVFCSGDLTDLIIFSGNASNYAWSHNGTGIGIANTGSNQIQAFQITNNSTQQSTVTFNVIPEVIFNNDVCSGIPTTFDLVINPNGQLNPLQNLLLCDGDSVPQIDFQSLITDGVMTYSWVNSPSSTSLPAFGNGDFLPAFVAQNLSAAPLFGQITIEPTYTNFGLSCVGPTQVFDISVNPIPQIVYVADTFICNAQQLNIVPQTNVNADFWWLGQANPDVSGISTSSQIGQGINDFLENTSATAQVVNYQITAVSPGTGCAGDTSFVEVVVEPSIFMTSPTVYEICSGTTVNSVLTSNVPVTYTWFATPNPNVSGATTFPVNSGEIQDTLINNSLTPQMIVYTVTPSTISGNCQGAPLIVSVLVNPELQITTPLNHTICNNGTLNIPITANANGNFSWYATQNSQVFGETSSIQNSTVLQDQLFNNSSIVQQVTYNLVVTSVDLGCSSQNFELIVEIIPTPSVVNLTDQTVCMGSVNPDFIPNGTFTEINWTNNNTASGIAAFANNVSQFSQFSAQNPNNFPITSTITITPVFSQNQLVCTGVQQSFNITVNPNGQVNFIPNIEVCNNTSIPAINLSSNIVGGNTTFSWANDNLSTGLNLTSGTGNIPNFMGFNTFSSVPIQSNIEVIANYINNNVSCPSMPITFQIIVNPIPILDPIPDLTFCNNVLVPEFNFSGVGTNHYVWNHNNLAIGLPLNGFGNLPQFTATNANQTDIQATVQVNSYFNSQISNLSCVGSSQQFVITILPAPFVSFTTAQDVYCSKNDVAFFNYSIPNLSFLWDFGDGGTSTQINPVHLYTLWGTFNVVLSGTDNTTGCVGMYVLPITILETPTISFSVDSAKLCYPDFFTFRNDIQAPFTNATWYFGDGFSVIQNDSVNHVYSDFKCYDVTLVVASENGCKDSLTQHDMVCYYEQPVAFFTTDKLLYNASGPVVTCFNSSQNSSSYLWDFGDMNLSTAINPVHTYPEQEMGYGIILTAFNEAGCSHQYGVFIQVLEDKIFYVPNSFSPQNIDGINDLFLPVITSGFDKNNFSFVVYNRWGEIIFETNDVTSGWNGLDSDGNLYPDGSYVWELTLRGILDDATNVYRGHVNLLR